MATETVETKTTEFEDGGTITETVTTETEYEPGSETEAIEGEVLPAIVEDAPVSDAVAIAAIEASAEVRVAEIASETTIELAEIHAEERADETSWQSEAQELRTNMRELMERMEALATTLSPGLPSIPPASGEELEHPPLIAEEPPSTPQSMSPPISETATEPSQESEGESPAAEAPQNHRPKRRLI